MFDGAELATQLRAFLKALFVLAEREPRPRAVAQFFIPHLPVRRD